MSKHFLFFITILFVAFTTSAQNKKYTIELYNDSKLQSVMHQLSVAEATFWADNLDLDSAMQSRVYYSTYSTYSQMVAIMRQLNYTIEKNVLQEFYNYKIRRGRFMKTFLDDKQIKTFEKIVTESAKKEKASYKDKPSKEINGLRNLAAGWNVLGHTITFKE